MKKKNFIRSHFPHSEGQFPAWKFSVRIFRTVKTLDNHAYFGTLTRGYFLRYFEMLTR